MRLWTAAAAGIVLSWAMLGCSGTETKAKPAPKPTPVVGVPARLGDLGVTETALGTVTPLATVTVRTRVDGELVKVAYREGQRLRAGDLMAQIDPRPFEVQLHQAEGQLAKDEAALANAKVDLERYRVLVKQDSAPQQQLDTQAAVVQQSEAAAASDRAEVESAKLNLTYCRITAPITGVVGLRLVDQGNIVHAADQNGLAVMTQEQPISVVFTIPADRLPAVLARFRSGDALPVEAWDRELRHKLAEGVVHAIDNQIDATTGTVKIRAQFANDDAALYPNLFVNVRLVTDTLRGVVLIPSAAIEKSPQGAYVYVVQKDAIVAMRNVTVAATEGDVAAVKDGVTDGEVVVTDGLDKIQPGATVTLGGGTKAKP
ncbi:MAG TPA: efflux RND transporter periplasmic adaptor subunit [Candidatus Polarisedimenticolaceae bacterium]|nr:efflux RND transporter periplasmic adaptor subunit [Candidatus Polarisedimenticolaceae bacterium]